MIAKTPVSDDGTEVLACFRSVHRPEEALRRPALAEKPHFSGKLRGEWDEDCLVLLLPLRAQGVAISVPRASGPGLPFLMALPCRSGRFAQGALLRQGV